jgi:hypothetical protein
MYSEAISTKAPPALPEDEFTLTHALKQEVGILAEYTGLYGFMASSAYQAIFPGVNQGKNVYFQGSRQMDNFSRRYYERELGAGIAPSPSMKEHFGYTEPFRRFVQRENFSPQANPLRNQMPGWLPGADYLTNFHIGDPYTKTRSLRPCPTRTPHAPAREQPTCSPASSHSSIVAASPAYALPGSMSAFHGSLSFSWPP